MNAHPTERMTEAEWLASALEDAIAQMEVSVRQFSAFGHYGHARTAQEQVESSRAIFAQWSSGKLPPFKVSQP